MGRWCSLFLPFADPTLAVEEIAAERLREALIAMGYTLYDPFGLIPGRAYPHTIKLFVAPGAKGWLGIVSAIEPESLTAKAGFAQTVFGADPFSLAVFLAFGEDDQNPDDVRLNVWVNGEKADPLAALVPYLKPGLTAEVLTAALTLRADARPSSSGEPVVMTLLPDEVKGLAEGVDEKQAQKLISRLSGSVMGKLGGAPANATDVLKSSAPNWNSPAGQRAAAIGNCLTLPQGWQALDFLAIRDAYALARRFERFPNAARMPGDQAALDAVPNARQFIPIYGGKG